MTIQTIPHLNLRGDARQALAFYHAVFGGRLDVMTYGDAHDSALGALPDQIKWGQVQADSGFRLMAYDVPPQTSWDAGDKPVFVIVEGDDAGQIGAYWTLLAEGAEIVAPLLPAQWATLYGMLKDRFGTIWVLTVPAPYQAA